MALAAGHDVQVSVSGLSNPDFGSQRRSATVEESRSRPRLRTLFVQAGLRRNTA